MAQVEKERGSSTTQRMDNPIEADVFILISIGRSASALKVKRSQCCPPRDHLAKLSADIPVPDR